MSCTWISKIDILKRTHGVEVEVGEPQVAYRETITQPIEDTYTHKKQSGGSGQFGRIDYIIEPAEPGTGFEFESTVTGGNVPREFWPAVEKGFKMSMDRRCSGWLSITRRPKVVLNDGAFHAVDSSALWRLKWLQRVLTVSQFQKRVHRLHGT